MVDYSKWKDIEISDDEDETHPNIDTPSLFRWRHQARIERMEEQKRERELFEKTKKDAACDRDKVQGYFGPVTALPVAETRSKVTLDLLQRCLWQRRGASAACDRDKEQGYFEPLTVMPVAETRSKVTLNLFQRCLWPRQGARHEKKLEEAKKKLAEGETCSGDMLEMKKALEELEKEEERIKKQDEELRKKETVAPWNVDTISNPGFTKTVINKAPPPRQEELSEEEREERMRKFVKENEKLLKKYGMFHKYDDSKKFLQENPHLACEDTANYLVIWCINLEMEGKHDLMAHAAHQCICMQYILELAKQLEVDPRACISSFFSKIQVAEVEYKNSFDDELRQFKERIKRRAAEKVKEAEEEERKERLGPGGLDPVEVFESLPEELKKCFETQDIPLLQKTIAAMPEEEAVYQMKRCVDSGLWVPDARKNQPEEREETPDTAPDVSPEK
uniref:Hsp90 co-chaperone Cdc37 n=1 Tax=Timema genevievae TaxID=629358 RepID=A0A7R9PMY0_TIMGE|nr:unnamed protein product [Timema genevievae]